MFQKCIKKLFCIILCVNVGLLCACDSKSSMGGFTSMPEPVEISPEVQAALANPSVVDSTTTRDNTPCVLETTAPGVETCGNDYAIIDYSNASDGYIMVNYLGNCSKVKLQVTGPNSVTYTYDIKNGYAAIPLPSGAGDYQIAVCENIVDTKYSLSYTTTLTFNEISEFGPYLHPNQYVNFKAENNVVTKAANLAAFCATDLDVVTNVYNYIISNITYDYEKADTVKSGYLSDVDEILELGTGICLDYASVMTSMLRSQRIPTRLEVGYVGEEMIYHAWISVYIEEIGWLNGVIQFNGKEWSLVDPTFGASTGEKTLRDYIGSGTNYSTKYIY